MNIVGTIKFGNRMLDVYQSLEVPLFKASDVADLIDYSIGNTWAMLKVCEEDEKITLPVIVKGQSYNVSFLTESGLYNVLSHSDEQIARYWRRLVYNELIEFHQFNKKNIVEQFNYWNRKIDDISFDEDLLIYPH